MSSARPAVGAALMATAESVEIRCVSARERGRPPLHAAGKRRSTRKNIF
jgi:hypothetical protein